MIIELFKTVGGIAAAGIVGKTVETIIKSNITIPNGIKNKIMISAGTIILADIVASVAYDHISEQIETGYEIYKNVKFRIKRELMKGKTNGQSSR